MVSKLHVNKPPLRSLGRSTLSARKPTGIRASAYSTWRQHTVEISTQALPLQGIQWVGNMIVCWMQLL